VPYREEFFKQLSKYKKVDAPGKSMNNMASIDQLYKGNIWERKRAFLSEYKFTIAFENYVYPGYQTEKLYDAMTMNSLPIYCGDPQIGSIFNTRSFVNVQEYTKTSSNSFIEWLERKSQPTFRDILPQFHRTPLDRIRRKAKHVGRSLKMKLQFKGLDFSDTIDRIIELDKNPDLYIQCLSEPWMKKGSISHLSTKQFWTKIFDQGTR
jgi:hypothetical protein